jgi:hypothetical protein
MSSSYSDYRACSEAEAGARDRSHAQTSCRRTLTEYEYALSFEIFRIDVDCLVAFDEFFTLDRRHVRFPHSGADQERAAVIGNKADNTPKLYSYYECYNWNPKSCSL